MARTVAFSFFALVLQCSTSLLLVPLVTAYIQVPLVPLHLSRHRYAAFRKQSLPRITANPPLWNFREDALSQELDKVEANLLGTNMTTTQQVDRRPMKIMDGAAIIAGTAVGGGFLALPSVTSPIGYLPTVVGLISACVFLVVAAIAFVETAALQSDLVAAESNANATTTGTSVASVIKFAFGKRWATLAGFGFLAQMLAVMTANVVKGAEIVSFCTGIPYAVACIVPAALIGIFTFGTSKPEIVESANTALTVMMIGGFAALIASTIAGGYAKTNAFGATLNKADWMRMLPNTSSAWAIPIFIKLLAFGEAVPLIIERMVPRKSADSTIVESISSETNNTIAASASDSKTEALVRVRSATVLGASVPLLLAIIWAKISVALVDPSSPNPIYSILAYGPNIAVPVMLLAYGAIGTTLLGAFLAMGHFCQDMICSKLGFCSLRWMRVSNVVTVAVPCILACFGPSLYLPLLAFAGAYPTTILYGLAPALAAMKLRRQAREKGIAIPNLIPGGQGTLVALATTALMLVGASTVRAGRHFLQTAT